MGDDRPGCHCPECLEADKVYQFRCPDCSDDLDGHHIAGQDRATSICENHRQKFGHGDATVEVVWRA